MTHGIMDNAGSFDNLIPLLPDSFFYICLDLPGHGNSSHFHPSLPVHTTDFLVVYKLAAEYFKRKRYILMAHSFGGHLSLLFSQVYPHYVSKLILFDVISMFPQYPHTFMEKLRRTTDLFLENISGSGEAKKTYTYERAVNKLIEARTQGTLTWSSAEPIARRMYEKVGEDMYVMKLDPRLKYRMDINCTFEYIIEMMRCAPVQCETLILLASVMNLDTSFAPVYQYYKQLGFTMHILDGDHDMHNNHPELVVEYVKEFLLKGRSKL